MYDFVPEEIFLKRLGEYVAIETPSANAAQMDQFDRLLKQDLLAIGAKLTYYPAKGGTVLQAEVGKGNKRVLLLGHKDTVFPLGTYEQNPYRIEERDGERVLCGPGVLDMKCGVLMAIELLRQFAKNQLPGVCITALFNCDEEIGSRESREIICQLSRQSVFCICLEPSVPGYCTVARKGLQPYTITAKGIAAHSGVNYKAGTSAIEGLCRVIASLYDLRDDEKDLSINIGSIEASGKNNIVNDLAVAKGELRCFDSELMQQTLAKMQDICDGCIVPGVTVSFAPGKGRPPMMQSEASQRLYEIAKECAKTHGLSLIGRAHGGGSDGSFAASEGIPVLDGMGGEGDHSHTANEFVRISTLYARLKLCADTIVKAVECNIGGNVK